MSWQVLRPAFLFHFLKVAVHCHKEKNVYLSETILILIILLQIKIFKQMITDKILKGSEYVNEFLTKLKDNGYDLTEYFIQIVPMHTNYGTYYFGVFYDTEYTKPKRK